MGKSKPGIVLGTMEFGRGPCVNSVPEETLSTMDKLHREGKFNQLGLSNYSGWLVNEVVNLCKANNWIKPTVYQGMYSAITRQVEQELIPCLRYHKIAFYAYSPLGGGILTGKYKYEEIEDNSMTTGRFNGVGGWKVDVYRGRYWKREHFSAIEHLKKLLVEHHPNEDISVPEAAQGGSSTTQLWTELMATRSYWALQKL